MCILAGITSETINLPDTVTEPELLARLRALNQNPLVDGVLVQLPVPRHISERRVCNAVVPHKDVDGFHLANVGRLCVDQRAMVPATPAAVIEIIKRTGQWIRFGCLTDDMYVDSYDVCCVALQYLCCR
jgi:methylenetetrahydrofolate dehydrogenase(NAD+)/5,10-methenyltetrahydrofolate cyclohydrolase